MKFGIVTAENVRRHVKPRHKIWTRTDRLLLRTDRATWKNRDIRSIPKRDILDLLDAMIERGSMVQATRPLGRLKPFFEWAAELGIIEAGRELLALAHSRSPPDVRIGLRTARDSSARS